MKESNLNQLLRQVLAAEASPEGLAEVLRELAVSEDRHSLRRAANGSQIAVREAAIRRQIELEPDQVEHYLELYRHFYGTMQRQQAAVVLDLAEQRAPQEPGLMRARLALHAKDAPADLLRLAKAYLPRFGSDPILGITIVRCEAVLQRAESEAAGSRREARVEVPRPARRGPSPVLIPAVDPSEPTADPRVAHIMAAMQRPAGAAGSSQRSERTRLVLPVEGPPPRGSD